jgi:hypothetical protein
MLQIKLKGTPNNMKNYRVHLTSLVDPVRDISINETDNPETKEYTYDIEANSAEEAKKLAKEMHGLSVWESDVYEN